jgi:hypothetical protein
VVWGGGGGGPNTVAFARVSIVVLGYIPGHCKKLNVIPPQKKLRKQKAGIDFSLVAFRKDIGVKNV